jgi:putative ABC transport system substrate-binding protein
VRRRDLIAAAGVLAAWPFAARAQQQERVRRLGMLFSGTEADAEGQARVAALKLGLLEHGWVEGRNLEIDYRWGGGDSSRLRAYAAELTALNPDVIFAAPSAALAEVQRATRTIPVVFAQVSDPVGAGFVTSLAHPGGNITGLRSLARSLPRSGI